MKAIYLVLVCLVVGCEPSNLSQSAPQPVQPQQTEQTAALPPVRHLLASGDGNDWNALSDREKLRLCNVIEETIGQHDAWHYREFLGNFYYDSANLSQSISSVAAVAAASD